MAYQHVSKISVLYQPYIFILIDPYTREEGKFGAVNKTRKTMLPSGDQRLYNCTFMSCC